MNYELIQNENGSKSVEFEDGTKHAVSVDNNQKEYFRVPNNYTDHPFKLFNNRIKDAIHTIREGHGDVLNLSGIFGPSESVLKFLDREYGEELRAQTIEGFKNTQFGYSLKFGYTNSFSGSRYISKKKEIISVFDSQNEYIFFDTEKAAETFKKELIEKAEQVVKEYIEIKSSGDESEIKGFINKNYQTDIVSELWAAIAEPSESNSWKLDVVQVIKQP